MQSEGRESRELLNELLRAWILQICIPKDEYKNAYSFRESFLWSIFPLLDGAFYKLKASYEKTKEKHPYLLWFRWCWVRDLVFNRKNFWRVGRKEQKGVTIWITVVYY